MISRPFTAAAASEWLRDLGLKSDEWWQSLDNQFEAVRYAEFYHKLLSPILWQRIFELFHTKTDLSRPRVEAIFKLRTVEDMRRAIWWPGVQPLDRSEPHTELYPTDGWIGEYLHYSQGSEIPMAWHFWFAVALIGAACRRNISIDLGTFHVFPYWYMMIIEETASAKSTAFGVALDMLSRACSQLEDAGREDRVIKIASQSATLQAFLDEIKSRDFLTILPDGSQLAGRTESCAVLPVDELVTLLGSSKYKPEEWVGFLTDLFGYTRPEWKDTKVVAGSRVLSRPGISFWAGSTMEWIKSSVTTDMFAGGFLGRFVFIKRRGDSKVVPRPHPLDPVWAESLAEFLTKLSLMDNTEFKFTPEAWEWHDQWYHSNKAKTARWQGDKFQAYFRRKQSHLLRLAMCMGISQGTFVGGVELMVLANTILEIEEEPMSWIFSDLGSHPDKTLCDYLLQQIEKERIPISYSKLLRNVRHRTGSGERTRQLLQTLVSAGELEVSRGKQGGLIYALSPKARIESKVAELESNSEDRTVPAPSDPDSGQEPK